MRANTGRKYDQIGFQVAVITEVHAQPSIFAFNDVGGGFLCMHLNTQFFDLVAQQCAAVGIQLHRHQAGREFHHVRLQAETSQCVGGFQA